MKTVSSELRHYRPAVAFEQFAPRELTRMLFLTLFVIGVVLLGVVWGNALTGRPWDTSLLMGLVAIDASLLTAVVLFRLYHNAHYYRGFGSVIGSTDRGEQGITYEVARVLLRNTNDVTGAFCISHMGREILLRVGISDSDIVSYVSSARSRVLPEQLPLPKERMFSLRDLGMFLYGYDTSFTSFLSKHNITEELYQETLLWVTSAYYATKQKERWWSKDNLSQHPGIGSEWAYGIPYLLNRFSHELGNTPVSQEVLSGGSYIGEYVASVEAVLAREDDANVLLVGVPGVGKKDVLAAVARRAKLGKALGAVQGQQYLVLDTDALIATHQTKQAFEPVFINLMNQAASAGNIVLIIEDISGFIQHAASIDVDVVSLIDPYLGSPELHVIAVSETGAYHTVLEVIPAFVRRFTMALMESPDLKGAVRFLGTLVPRYEARYGTFMTYPALRALVDGADRYIVSGVMPDKAVHLLDEVMHNARQSGVIVTVDFVESYIREKTGIPVGEVQEEERDTLLNLEETLHARVIGQEGAIAAISSTMRRARAGIQDSEKPIGTFLFLGPTGVGKTETAKALAHVFFGDEAHMVRLDMSEYGEEGSVTRLIGDGATPGVLTEKMHEHPYAVLLLDEFEKAERSVHDLFLQILDEGVFTNARGESINMRNTIIIATSNAGSQRILDTIKQGLALSTAKDSVVDAIIADGHYRPELINRFDATVLFEPLTRDEQRRIAMMLLEALGERVRDRGYTLAIDDVLIDTVVREGYSETFGARPMRRVIQDMIEEAIAQKIIAGGLQKGQTITLTKEDIPKA